MLLVVGVLSGRRWMWGGARGGPGSEQNAGDDGDNEEDLKGSVGNDGKCGEWGFGDWVL